ncbi:MAG: HAD family hydrolase [Lachnospiraceae bacterium]
MKKGVIFDMDGLLLDTERIYREGWEITAKEFGVLHNLEFPKAICGTSGSSMVAVVEKYYPEVDANAFIKACRSYVHESVSRFVPEKPGIHEILNYFKERGVKIAVASSSQPQIIKNNLQKVGVLDQFDAVVSGAQVEHGKPAPDIFLEAARQIGCEPKDCYVFEDGRNGIKAGVAAGCDTIMIPDLTEPDEELKSLCVAIYPSLIEAMEAIERGEI